MGLKFTHAGGDVAWRVLVGVGTNLFSRDGAARPVVRIDGAGAEAGAVVPEVTDEVWWWLDEFVWDRPLLQFPLVRRESEYLTARFGRVWNWNTMPVISAGGSLEFVDPVATMVEEVCEELWWATPGASRPPEMRFWESTVAEVLSLRFWGHPDYTGTNQDTAYAKYERRRLVLTGAGLVFAADWVVELDRAWAYDISVGNEWGERRGLVLDNDFFLVEDGRLKARRLVHFDGNGWPYGYGHGVPMPVSGGRVLLPGRLGRRYVDLPVRLDLGNVGLIVFNHPELTENGPDGQQARHAWGVDFGLMPIKRSRLWGEVRVHGWGDYRRLMTNELMTNDEIRGTASDFEGMLNPDVLWGVAKKIEDGGQMAEDGSEELPAEEWGDAELGRLLENRVPPYEAGPLEGEAKEEASQMVRTPLAIEHFNNLAQLVNAVTRYTPGQEPRFRYLNEAGELKRMFAGNGYGIFKRNDGAGYCGPRPRNAYARVEPGSAEWTVCEELGIPIRTINDLPVMCAGMPNAALVAQEVKMQRVVSSYTTTVDAVGSDTVMVVNPDYALTGGTSPERYVGVWHGNGDPEDGIEAVWPFPDEAGHYILAGPPVDEAGFQATQGHAYFPENWWVKYAGEAVLYGTFCLSGHVNEVQTWAVGTLWEKYLNAQAGGGATFDEYYWVAIEDVQAAAEARGHFFEHETVGQCVEFITGEMPAEVLFESAASCPCRIRSERTFFSSAWRSRTEASWEMGIPYTKTTWEPDGYHGADIVPGKVYGPVRQERGFWIPRNYLGCVPAEDETEWLVDGVTEYIDEMGSQAEEVGGWFVGNRAPGDIAGVMLTSNDVVYEGVEEECGTSPGPEWGGIDHDTTFPPIAVGDGSEAEYWERWTLEFIEVDYNGNPVSEGDRCLRHFIKLPAPEMLRKMHHRKVEVPGYGVGRSVGWPDLSAGTVRWAEGVGHGPGLDEMLVAVPENFYYRVDATETPGLHVFLAGTPVTDVDEVSGTGFSEKSFVNAYARYGVGATVVARIPGVVRVGGAGESYGAPEGDKEVFVRTGKGELFRVYLVVQWK